MSGPPTQTGSLGAAAGTATLVTGLLLLAFAGYQLWGTAMTEARAQEELAQALETTLSRTAPSPGAPATGSTGWPGDEPGLVPVEPADAALVTGRSQEIDLPMPTTANLTTEGAVADPVATTAARSEPRAIGQPMARLQIPTIGVDKTVVEGTTREALRTGPGHYVGTAQPGQLGNVAIAGHRTTYGAPFHDIDQLEPGDPIVVETEDGVFTYRVEAQPLPDGGTSGHHIVAPEDVHVIADRGDHRLTLTACHPRYSARQRIIVTAVLDQPEPTDTTQAAEPIQTPLDAVAAPTEADPDASAPPTPVGWSGRGWQDRTVSVPVVLPTTTDGVVPDPGSTDLAGPARAPDAGLEDDLGWQTQHVGATAGWAALTTLVAAGAWLLARRWRRVPAYLMATPTFTLCLVTCFGHLDRLIPAS